MHSLKIDCSRSGRYRWVCLVATFLSLLSACAGRVAPTADPRESPAAPSSPASPASPCTLSAADAAWAERAQRAWNLSLQDFLQLPPETGDLTFVLFDASCVYRGNRNMNPQGEAHTGTVALPNGQSVPAQVTSFSVSGEGKDFMVMALPPIWRAANVQSELSRQLYRQKHDAQDRPRAD